MGGVNGGGYGVLPVHRKHWGFYTFCPRAEFLYTFCPRAECVPNPGMISRSCPTHSGFHWPNPWLRSRALSEGVITLRFPVCPVHTADFVPISPSRSPSDPSGKLRLQRENSNMLEFLRTFSRSPPARSAGAIGSSTTAIGSQRNRHHFKL